MGFSASSFLYVKILINKENMKIFFSFFSLFFGGGGGSLIYKLQFIVFSFQLPFSLPPGVFLVLGDIAGGSETPFMVRKVLAWKNESELDNGALGLWNSIALINSRVAQLFDVTYSLLLKLSL